MVCEKCGRVLLPGEICPCEQRDIFQRHIELEEERMEEEAEEARLQAEKDAETMEKIDRASKKVSKAKNRTADVSVNVFQYVMTIFRTPYDGIMEFVENANIINAVILMIAQAIVLGIVAIASIASSLLGELAFGIVISKFSLFIVVLLTSIAGSIGCALGFLLISKINKSSIDFNEAMCFSTAKSVLVIPISIVALVLMLVNGILGLGFLIISMIAGVAIDSIGLRLISEEDNKHAFYLTGIHTISTIITCIIFMLSSSILL